MSGTRTLGVTIGAGDPFRRMAELAAERFTKCTGHPAFILGDKERAALTLAKPHHLKFELFRIFPDAEEIVFFDADVIFCERFDLNALRSEKGFSAARDFVNEWWIKEDSTRAGIPNTEYLNSGLFWIHRSRADVLPMARSLRDSGEIKTPFNDQTFINAAVSRTGGAHYLNKRFNFHVDRKYTSSLEGVVGAHIHWIPKDAERIEAYYREPRSLFWRNTAPSSC